MGQSEIALSSSLATTAILFAVLYLAVRRSRSNRPANDDRATETDGREGGLRTIAPVILPMAAVESHLHKLACEVEVILPLRIRRIDQQIDEADREIARLFRQFSTEDAVAASASQRVPDVLPIDAPLLPIQPALSGRLRTTVVEPRKHHRIRRAA